MADQRSDRQGPSPSSPSEIRNVVLVGPAGAGKTTLIEHLLHAAGAIPRIGRVEDGTTTCDHEPAALREHRSVGLSVASFCSEDLVITLIDTPGHAEFVGEVRAGLRGADAALFVVASADGIDAATGTLWDECEAIGLPRAVVVTKLDMDRADFEETVAVCHRMLTGSGGVLPMYLPIHADDGQVTGFIDLLTTRIHYWDADGHHVQHADPEHVALVAGARTDLIEGIITESEDETLMDRFIAGEHLEAQVLMADLERVVARGYLHPVLGHAAEPGSIGSSLVLDLIARGFPSPTDRAVPPITTVAGEPLAPLSADPDGPVCAEVIKTTDDRSMGTSSIVRVFSGTIRPQQPVHVRGHIRAESGHVDHDADVRIGLLGAPLGAQARFVPQAVAGAIVSISRLAGAQTGDTLSSPETPMLMQPWPMPEPMPGPILPSAVAGRSAADHDRLG